MEPGARGSQASGGPTLDDVGEAGVLTEVFARLRGLSEDDVLVGPGDDTALLSTHGPVLATTDTVVRDRDWRDEWSGPQDVGHKVVVQNLADLAAMGGVGAGLLVSLVAPGSLPLSWVQGLTDGIAEAAGREGVPVLGGDLSSSTGEVVVSVTALGGLAGKRPVLRSGARSGDVVAVAGSLGRSGAGLLLLERGEAGWWPPQDVAQEAAALVGYHCRPAPDLAQGPVAARAGAHAMIDLSDGLVRDLRRVCQASGVCAELDRTALEAFVAPLAAVLGPEAGWQCVLAGGEEHSLLACFAASDVPPGWQPVGRLAQTGPAGPGVCLEGDRLEGGGWDHFGG